MSDNPDYYDFGGVRLFTAETHLEVPATGKEYTPSKNHRNFLLALARKAPGVVTYEELWRDVWRSKSPMSSTDLRNIQTTKGSLISWLDSGGIKTVIIEAEPGEGYRLANEVTPSAPKRNPSEAPELNFNDEVETNDGLTLDPEIDDAKIYEPEANICEIEDASAQSDEPSPTIDTDYNIDTKKDTEEKRVEDWKKILHSYAGFIIPVGTFYGMLFLVAAVMEIAYRFDLYGRQAVIWGAALTAINTSAFFAACRLIVYRLYYGGKSFVASAGILLGTASGSILLSALFLPFAPITEAEFNTQPAFMAFGKNVLLYFLPLGIGFLLLPFYIVIGTRMVEFGITDKIPLDTVPVKPEWLLVICLVTIIFSYSSSSYMLDRLNTESDYHAVFVGSIMLRATIYFGLALTSIAWYYAQTKKQSA